MESYYCPFFDARVIAEMLSTSAGLDLNCEYARTAIYQLYDRSQSEKKESK